MHNLLEAINPEQLIRSFGYLGLFLAVFMESGVFVGFFLPGDSLLFTAGLLASQHTLGIELIIPICIVGAILGDSAGYYTGRKFGPTLFNKPKSVVFSPKRVRAAHEFFESRGPQSLILARFVPAVRTFTPIVAGVATMRYKTFLTFNIVGAVSWGTLVPLLGFTLGKAVPSIDTYLLPIVLAIGLISALPLVVDYIRKRKNNSHPTD